MTFGLSTTIFKGYCRKRISSSTAVFDLCFVLLKCRGGPILRNDFRARGNSRPFYISSLNMFIRTKLVCCLLPLISLLTFSLKTFANDEKLQVLKSSRDIAESQSTLTLSPSNQYEFNAHHAAKSTQRPLIGSLRAEVRRKFGK